MFILQVQQQDRVTVLAHLVRGRLPEPACQSHQITLHNSKTRLQTSGNSMLRYSGYPHGSIIGILVQGGFLSQPFSAIRSPCTPASHLYPSLSSSTKLKKVCRIFYLVTRSARAVVDKQQFCA